MVTTALPLVYTFKKAAEICSENDCQIQSWSLQEGTSRVQRKSEDMIEQSEIESKVAYKLPGHKKNSHVHLDVGPSGLRLEGIRKWYFVDV